MLRSIISNRLFRGFSKGGKFAAHGAQLISRATAIAAHRTQAKAIATATRMQFSKENAAGFAIRHSFQ